MPVLDHVTLTAADLQASAAFYDAALAPLGLGRLIDLSDEEEDDLPAEAVAYGDESGAVLWLVVGGRASRAVHLSFRAVDRDAVERFHAAAVGAGGTSHDAPRRWPLYRTPGEFNAIVADPDGNLIEAVSAE
jgi:catechol 2,3-dioxygenase-like lactoylglutathione lyase family enzyme